MVNFTVIGRLRFVRYSFRFFILNFFLVFKLPEELNELEFAEEKSNLDENIMSSLSLGPGCLNNASKFNNNGKNLYLIGMYRDELIIGK